MRLHAAVRGKGGPALLLLHGLAANGRVWDPLLDVVEESWPGRIVVPDLRGHGLSPHAPHYGFGHQAADAAQLFERGERIAVLGHSLGAAVGLCLASGWFGVEVAGLVGVGLKLRWSGEELRRVDELAQAPVRWFDTFEEAAARFLKVSGLQGLLPVDHPAVRAGVSEREGRFRLSADPAAASAGAGEPAAMRRLARGRCWFACGGQDPLLDAADLLAFDPDGHVFEGLGHNVHAQDPRVLWDYAAARLAEACASSSIIASSMLSN